MALNLMEEIFVLDIGKELLAMKVVRPWHRFQRTRSFLSLEMLCARLDGALSSLVCWKVSLSMAGSWTEISFKVPSNPKHSVILPNFVATMFEVFHLVSLLLIPAWWLLNCKLSFVNSSKVLTIYTTS